MAAKVAARLDTDMSHWPPGTRHYSVGDGTYIAVDDDSEQYCGAMADCIEKVPRELTGKPMHYVKRPTVIIACDGNGYTASLDRLHTFPPGTTCEQALHAAGYTIEDPCDHTVV